MDPNRTLTLQPRGDSAVELTSGESGTVLWRLEHADETPKPYVHPMRTLQGHCLTDHEPADHPWHRGLWFTVKYVDGCNFWEEEHDPYGTQRVEKVSCGGTEETGLVELAIEWRAGTRPDPFLREVRQVQTRVLDERRYLLDWTSRLSTSSDVLLERTPYAVRAPRQRERWPGGPPFPAWGGYGGLVIRTAPDLEIQGFRLADSQALREPPTGETAPWCALTGSCDGAPVTLGFIDHPSNPRHPTPWYGGSNGRLLNAAVLFHEPMAISADEPLTLRYRLVVADGHLADDELDAYFEDFTAADAGSAPADLS